MFDLLTLRSAFIARLINKIDVFTRISNLLKVSKVSPKRTNHPNKLTKRRTSLNNPAKIAAKGKRI
jgi:hypothetical protein